MAHSKTQSPTGFYCFHIPRTVRHLCRFFLTSITINITPTITISNSTTLYTRLTVNVWGAISSSSRAS